MPEFQPALSRAQHRALPLLAPCAAPPAVTDGYIDLLDGPEGPPANMVQALWQSRLGSGLYSRVQHAALLKKLHRGVRDRLRLVPGETVLDLGCGPGGLTNQLAETVTDTGLVVAVDLSAQMLTTAIHQVTTANIAFFRGDATRLPFSDGVFDVVCCSAVFQLLPEPFTVLDQVTRMLKPGGRVVILTTYRGRRFARGLVATLGRLSGAHMFEAADLPTALARCGYHGIAQQLVSTMQLVVAHKGD